MAKLTNYLRERIEEAALSHAFIPRYQALKDIESDLAKAAYQSLFSAAELKKVEVLPENWIRKDACLQFNVGGQRINLDVKGDGLPVPYRPKGNLNGSYGCNVLGSIPHGELCDMIQKHAQALEQYKTDRRSAQVAIRSMLNAVTTTGKLKEVWPEGAQFFSKFDDEPKTQLPAVRVDEVNAMLGLSVAA